MLDDFMWLDTPPPTGPTTSACHAGYDPRMPLDMQGEKELLWIRKEWFQYEGAVDPARTVFSDTTTTETRGCSGEIARSSVLLADGRPAWVGLDVGAYNHVSLGLAAVNISTFATAATHATMRRWFDRINASKTKGKKKRAWKGKGNQREAEVAQVLDQF